MMRGIVKRMIFPFSRPETDLVQAATERQHRRDWKGAAELWQQVTLGYPENFNAWLQLGNTWNELGRHDDAIRCFLAAGRLQPAAPEVPEGIAGVHERTGHWDLALKYWQTTIAILTGSTKSPAADQNRLAHAFHHAALAAKNCGAPERAAEFLLRATERASQSPDRTAEYLLRAQLLKDRDPKWARELLSEYITRYPNDAGARFEMASICLRLEEYELGLKVFRPALEQQPNEISFLWLAADLNERLRRWNRVAELCDVMARTDPADKRFVRRAYDAAIADGDLPTARRLAREFTKNFNDYDLICSLIQAYEADRDFVRARLICRFMLTKSPQSTEHRARYITLTARTRSLAKADALLRAELETRGRDVEIERAYCDAAFRAGNFSEAKRRLAAFIQAHPDDQDARVFLGYAIANVQGICAGEQHFAELAACSFQAKAPLVGLAHMAMRRRDPYATLRYWTHVAELFPDDVIARVEWARAAYEIRDYRLVRRICEPALARNPSDVTLGEFYAWFLVATGCFTEAYQYIDVLRRYSGRSWSLLELAILAAWQTGLLEQNFSQILEITPRAVSIEASRRFYQTVRHLVCAQRSDLVIPAFRQTRLNPRNLPWLWPYVRTDVMAGCIGREAPDASSAEAVAVLEQQWAAKRRLLRDDAARQIAGASEAEISRILSRPRSEQPTVHVVNKFEQISGGSELHALDIAKQIGRYAKVQLWSPEMPHPKFSNEFGVQAIELGQGKVPHGGVLVVIGVYFEISAWLEQARPQRVIFLYNTFEAPLLFRRLTEVHARTGVRAEVIYCSGMMEREVDLPGFFEPSPVDINLFVPRTMSHFPEHRFTVGRHSRDVIEKHHPEDWRVYKAVAKNRGQIRLLGGTCMADVFPAFSSIEFLPSRNLDIVEFLHSLDCYYYRTSTWIEPWGRVVVEAMACGLPVVASRVGGYAQIIEHGRNGLLFHDTEEACQQVMRVARDLELRRSLGAEARRTAENLLNEAAIERLVAFYLAPASEP
jgi:glycosyltransferase involved in cell wall biosynthesis